MTEGFPTGRRVRLRAFRHGDFDAVQRYAGDPEVSRYMTWGPNSPAETEAFLTHVLAHSREEPRRAFELAIVNADDGELLGGARIGILSSAHRRGDIGYVLRRDVWGQGIATEAAGLLLGFGFETLGLHRIEATCDPENIGSRRVLEKIGMRQEGLRRQDLLARGTWRDSLLFAILAPEWEAARAR